MPKYVYNCKECDANFEIVHGMTERQEQCIVCLASECLVRIPQMPYIKTFDSEVSDSRSVGSLVKEAIEENTKILKEQKKEARSQEYKDDK